MRAPIRPLRGRWPAVVERRLDRFFWSDPRVIADADADAAAFRLAMSAIHVNNTIKITGAKRHPEADSLLIDNVDTSRAHIVDMGASDGSTSVELIAKLRGFAAYTIADLFFQLSVEQVRHTLLFYVPGGELTLIVGRRTLAWPSQSRVVRALYKPVRMKAKGNGAELDHVLLVNPDARKLIAADARVNYRVHDIFDPWVGRPPDVIKVANLLRRMYFSDADINRALYVLIRNLPEGGHLLIVDNPRIEGIAERAGLYRRDGGRFTIVAESNDPPEIADLVARVRHTEVPGS